MYNNAYGLWEVTTEGDCEGKSTRKLGVILLLHLLEVVVTPCDLSHFLLMIFLYLKILNRKSP